MKIDGLDGVMTAELVWDGGNEVRIPPVMGQPRSDQMQGTAAERLTELCGRVCYDSLGRGRASPEYHTHIQEVGHLSVCEHFNITIEVQLDKPALLAIGLLNRPGTWTEIPEDADGAWKNVIRITTNPRAVLEWDRWVPPVPRSSRLAATALGYMLRRMFTNLAPLIVLPNNDEPAAPDFAFTDFEAVRIAAPESDHEKWISLYMAGSRGFGNEQVRHGDETGISQRSTRYVNESESEWVMHPLLRAYLTETGGDHALEEMARSTVFQARMAYDAIVERLEEWLLSRMPEGTPFRTATARKQARGAARGFLGNALQTDMIFSASIAQWRHMLRMRAADAADGEIRCVYTPVVAALKASRYADRFADVEMVPASDGLGLSLKGGGAR